MIARPRRPMRARRNPRTGLVGPDSSGTVISNSSSGGAAPVPASNTYGTSKTPQTYEDQDWSGQDYGSLFTGIGKGIGGILSGVGDIIEADNDPTVNGSDVPAGSGAGGGSAASYLPQQAPKPFPWTLVFLGLAGIGAAAFFLSRGKDD